MVAAYDGDRCQHLGTFLDCLMDCHQVVVVNLHGFPVRSIVNDDLAAFGRQAIDRHEENPLHGVALMLSEIDDLHDCEVVLRLETVASSRADLIFGRPEVGRTVAIAP